MFALFFDIRSPTKNFFMYYLSTHRKDFTRDLFFIPLQIILITTISQFTVQLFMSVYSHFACQFPLFLYMRVSHFLTLLSATFEGVISSLFSVSVIAGVPFPPPNFLRGRGWNKGVLFSCPFLPENLCSVARLAFWFFFFFSQECDQFQVCSSASGCLWDCP